MIIALKTDSPEAAIVLLNTEGTVIDNYSWQAHRTLAKDLLRAIYERLQAQGSDWQSITGIILLKGPGSFTGLRIGAAVANTIAHAQSVPIVGTTGENWLPGGVERLQAGHNEQIVMPEYGAPARITQPKK